MARIKKLLAAISVAAALCTMLVCSINVSALCYEEFYRQQGKYYTRAEIEAMHVYFYLNLELDDSIATLEESENGSEIFVIDKNTELFKYMENKLGITSDKWNAVYIKYDYEKDDILTGYPQTDGIEEYKALTDEELIEKGVKRYAQIAGYFGHYNNIAIEVSKEEKALGWLGVDELYDEIQPLSGVKALLVATLMPASSPGEPVDVEPLTGDLSMDGKVNIVDAVKLAKYNSDPTAYPLLTYSQLAADINGDGELTNADLIALVKMI